MTLNAATTTVLTRLMATPLTDPGELTSRVDAHLAAVRKAADDDPFVDLDTAEQIAATLHRLLALWPTLSDDHRGWAQAAAAYFVQTDDGTDDFDSVIGFSDDLDVLTHALDRIGRRDLLD